MTETRQGLALANPFGDFGLGSLVAASRAGTAGVTRFGGVEIVWNSDAVIHDLGQAARAQLPFAMARALNMTVEDAQQATRDRIRMRGFIIRSANTERWLMNQVKIYPADRAKKDKLEAAITVEGGAGFGARDPGSFTGRSLLAFLERGGERVGVRQIGAGSVFGPAVAIPLRRTPMEQIPRALYPINLGLQARRKIEGRKTQPHLRGKRRTFTVRTATGEGLVLQRQGRGKENVRALFLIRPRSRVTGRQFFYSTVERVVRERLAYNFGLSFAEAQRTAKPRNA